MGHGHDGDIYRLSGLGSRFHGILNVVAPPECRVAIRVRGPCQCICNGDFGFCMEVMILQKIGNSHHWRVLVCVSIGPPWSGNQHPVCALALDWNCSKCVNLPASGICGLVIVGFVWLSLGVGGLVWICFATNTFISTFAHKKLSWIGKCIESRYFQDQVRWTYSIEIWTCLGNAQTRSECLSWLNGNWLTSISILSSSRSSF